MFRRVLIANRGEIALRIIRTLREMDITSIAVFSDVDRDARFVQEADEAYRLGPAPAMQSYLNVEAILSIASQANAEAVHPGYGFLAENAGFASAVAGEGLTFIGPSPEAIQLMGDKVEARRVAESLGVPVVPGSPGPVTSADQALEFADQAGYPVAVKAAGGGGGRGIRVVEQPDDIPHALERARREAEAHFKNPEVYLERYFPDPRHVEIQVLGDHLGNLVHLGERDCSIQRRHQKLIEETPSPVVDRDLRARMGEMALRVAGSVGYSTAGTVEFLLTSDGRFYFLEMNTRIQVEHPVTELVTGVDLIREMVLGAGGDPITVKSSALELNGHAIEVRVNAEEPLDDFRPTPAIVTRYREPGGVGIRVDSGLYEGYAIPGDYDSLIAKLSAWAPDREGARLRVLRALREYEIVGPATTIGFAAAVLRNPEFVQGKAGTTFVETHLGDLEAQLERHDRARRVGKQSGPGTEREFNVEVNRKLFHVRVEELQSEYANKPKKRRAARQSRGSSGFDLVSPMHGTIISVNKQPGESVSEGETLFIIEAMKMENDVSAHRSGTLSSLAAHIGDTVEADQVLAVIE